MLYREPKLLKSGSFVNTRPKPITVSVLYREPKLLKSDQPARRERRPVVSVLYREPKLLKFSVGIRITDAKPSFSALP